MSALSTQCLQNTVLQHVKVRPYDATSTVSCFVRFESCKKNKLRLSDSFGPIFVTCMQEVRTSRLSSFNAIYMNDSSTKIYMNVCNPVGHFPGGKVVHRPEYSESNIFGIKSVTMNTRRTRWTSEHRYLGGLPGRAFAGDLYDTLQVERKKN